MQLQQRGVAGLSSRSAITPTRPLRNAITRMCPVQCKQQERDNAYESVTQRDNAYVALPLLTRRGTAAAHQTHTGSATLTPLRSIFCA